MKRWVSPFSGLFLALTLPQGALAQTPSSTSAEVGAKKAEAQAIIDVMFPPASRVEMINTMLDQVSKGFRDGCKIDGSLDPGLQKLMKDMLDEASATQRPLIANHMPALFEAMASAYTREFSLDELKQVHAFALTPAGKHYLSRSSAILGDPDVQRENAAMMSESQVAAQKMLADFKVRISEYFDAHPEVIEKMKGK